MQRLGLGLKDVDVDVLVDAIDKDGSGTIEQAEFMHTCCLEMLRGELAAWALSV